MELKEDNIIKYLGSLSRETLQATKEYIQKATEQIDTKLRRTTRKGLVKNWAGNPIKTLISFFKYLHIQRIIENTDNLIRNRFISNSFYRGVL